MIRLLDRYLARTFLKTLLWTATLVLLLFLLVDLISSAREFMKDASGIWGHYALRVPVVLVMSLPFATVIAAVFTVTQFEKSREFLPQKAAGLPLSRVLRPIFVTALAVGLFGSALQEWLFPQLQGFSEPVRTEDSGFMKPPPILLGDETLSLLRYDPRSKTAQWVLLTMEGEDGGHEEIFAASMAWDAAEQAWLLSRGQVLRQGSSGESSIRSFRERSQTLQLKPLDIETAQLKSVDLATGFHPATFLNLAALWRQMQKHAGSTSASLLFYDRLGYPLSFLVLCLVGVPMALPRENRARILGVMMGAGLCLAFFVVSFVFRELALRSWISPEMAVGLPLAAFFAGGWVLLQEAPS